MPERRWWMIGWLDIVWLLFIAGLAILPPVDEVHKQLILAGIGLYQFIESWLIAHVPKRGASYSVLIKLALATLLLVHTGEVGINSIYYPIYYLPLITAAIYFGPIGTLIWTALISLSYLSLLIPVLPAYEFEEEGEAILAIRILFFFLAAILVNRFVVENRRQVRRFQALSETLEETNRQLQRAEAEARRSERLAALGQMSAGLAHEIRNPLGVIKGSAEMLAQKVRDAQPLAGELAGYISSEVNRLNSLVARFLDFARPAQLDLRPERLSDIVDRALESVQAELPRAKVHVERQYPPNLPEVMADRESCERVFVNLILNAYQAMDGQPTAPEGTLRLSIAPDSSHGRSGVVVAVEDSGPGVPAELREQVFNPFVTSKKGGTGLGLAIVAKIVDDHGGWIRLESEPGKGARFRVFLPCSHP